MRWLEELLSSKVSDVRLSQLLSARTTHSPLALQTILPPWRSLAVICSVMTNWHFRIIVVGLVLKALQQHQGSFTNSPSEWGFSFSAFKSHIKLVSVRMCLVNAVWWTPISAVFNLSKSICTCKSSSLAAHFLDHHNKAIIFLSNTLTDRLIVFLSPWSWSEDIQKEWANEGHVSLPILWKMVFFCIHELSCGPV